MIDINPSQTTPSPPSQPGPQGRSQSPASPSPPPTLQEAFPRYVPPAPPSPPPTPPVPQERGINKGLIFCLNSFVICFCRRYRSSWLPKLSVKTRN